MKKKIIFIFLLVLMLLIVGCAKKAETPTGPFVGGENGLEIGYVSGEPPESVFDNNQEDFDITVKVENVGEFDIPANKVIATLSGISAPDFSISNPNIILKNPLEGTHKVNSEIIKGDEDELRFENAKYKHDLVADFSTSVRTDICYLYETKTTTKACLKRKATQRDIDDACQVNNDNIRVDNSGAPIQISGVRERSAGTNEVQLTFTVENMGSGITYPPDTFTNTCVRKQDKEDRLKIEVRTGSNRHTVKCAQLNDGASGEIKLSENKRPLRCTISTANAPDGGGAFEEPINIIASYFYKNAITTPLDVQDSEE